MSEKLVTVVMTTYNEFPYIRKTISSVLNQTYKNIEIIINDDGSEDGTQDILKEYLQLKNFKIIFREHTGNIGKNLNDCIKLAKGDVIAILGADDLWMNHKIKIQMEYLKNDKIVCSNGNVIDSNDNIFYEQVNNFGKDRYIDLCQLLIDNRILSSSVLAYKNVLLESGLFDESVGNRSEDYELWINISRKYKIKYINQILMSYRFDGQNLSQRSFADKREFSFRNLKLISPFLTHEDFHIVKSAIEGVSLIYARLTKFFYLDGDISNSHYYCKKLLSNYKKKFSFKFLKYFTFYLYINTLNLSLRLFDNKNKRSFKNFKFISPFHGLEDAFEPETIVTSLVNARLTKHYYLNGDIKNSLYYCNLLILNYKRRFSLRFIKYLTFYLYINILSCFKK